MATTDERRASATRVIRFSNRVFGLDEIKKAAYRFTDSCVFEFSIDGDDVICVLRPADAENATKLPEIEDAFRTEVLDQDLRRRISDETAPIRNAILAFAFSKTGVQE